MITYTVHPVNPQRRYIEATARICKYEGGIAVYPTDTVYGIGAALSNVKGIERIGRLLQKDNRRLFSFICSDFSQMSNYVHLSNAHFKLMKRYLPGPYTFILPATHLVPKKISPKRKTVGVRIPDCPTVIDLVTLLGEPLANTSVNLPGSFRGNPDEVRDAVLNEVDVMLDAGQLDDPTGSTIIDLTNDIPEVIRSGKGVWNE
ncbi:MAG: threonylcarbamoyl-AMP synthase [Chitinispirillaceae bacterium]|nr:threonylcarbamoyl-AMP synthase [Chitinispirillaceae bacterium]